MGWAEHLRVEAHALYLACKDPRVPWYAKALAACVVGYALSPIDLIPDFIPVIGYLDDLLIVPLGIALAIRLIPPAVLSECRAQAQAAAAARAGTGRHWVTVLVIVALWALLLAWGAWAVWRMCHKHSG